MADRTDKVPENASGRFFVDQTCIDCDACREMAPDNFTRSDEEGYSYVHRQPVTEQEIEECRDALEGCPVEAIGEDGD